MERHRTTWTVLAVVVTVVAYYASTFGIGHALGSTARYRIILAMLFAQSLGLVMLGWMVMSLMAELRPYQRAASQLALLKGMWRSLDIAAQNGGISTESREAIYKEADEVFGRYADLMREGDKGA